MLSIPLSFFLLLYLLLFGTFIIFALINFFHIISSGEFTFISFVMSVGVFVLAFGVFSTTWYILESSGIDFSTRVTLFDSAWIPSLFFPSSSNPF